MSDRPTNAALEALRHTLERVEGESGLAPDDLVLVELKRILLMRIATLEAARLPAPAMDAAAIDPAANPADEPAVAVAIDLAISLLANHLSGRPFERGVAVLENPRSGSDPDVT